MLNVLIQYIQFAFESLRFYLLHKSKLNLLTSKFAWPFTKLAFKYSTLLVDLFFDNLNYFAELAVLIVLSTVLICCLKCVRPQYELYSKNVKEKQLKRSSRLQETKQTTTNTLCRKGQAEKRVLFGSKFGARRFHVEPEDEDTHILAPVSDEDVQSINGHLSWSQTQLEVESTKWLNNTLRAFLPFLKGQLDKCLKAKLVQEVVGKSKAARKHQLKQVATAPSAQQPQPKRPTQKVNSKLSVFLTCRRKLNLLRQVRLKASEREKGTFCKCYSLFEQFSYFFKIFTVYLKQFLVDLVTNFVKRNLSSSNRQTEVEEEKVRRVNLKDMMEKMPKSKVVDRRELNLPRHSVFMAPPSETATSKRWLLRVRPSSRKDSVSAKTHLTSGLVGKRHKLKRDQLANQLNAKLEQVKLANRAVSLERLDLGDSVPFLSGIKFIEANNNLLSSNLSGANGRVRQIKPSDSRNIRFAVELSFKSRGSFCVALRNLPLIGSLKLRKLFVQMRVIININHTITSQDKNLDIFATSDSLMPPILNQIQVALFDVPQLDWHFASCSCSKGEKKKLRLKGANEKPLTFWRSPSKLLNNSYFKFMIHKVIYFILKWFKPFELCLGERICVRSLF